MPVRIRAGTPAINPSVCALSLQEKLTGKSVTVYEADTRDYSALMRVFESEAVTDPIDTVVHLAGLKAVGESVEQPHRESVCSYSWLFQTCLFLSMLQVTLGAETLTSCLEQSTTTTTLLAASILLVPWLRLAARSLFSRR